jgi:hypothetical protein
MSKVAPQFGDQVSHVNPKDEDAYYPIVRITGRTPRVLIDGFQTLDVDDRCLELVTTVGNTRYFRFYPA